MSQRAFIAFVLFFAVCATGVAQDSGKIVARYKQMLEKNPGEGTALDRLWSLYQEKSATAQLLDEYKSAAEKNDYPSVLIYGHLLRKAGKPGEARAAFRSAAALNPQSPLPHLALAQMASEQSSPKEAATEYESAAGLMPPADSGLPDILLKLGAAWFSAGDTAKASDAWERAVALAPKNLALREQLAKSYLANDLPDKAVPHYEAIEANGDVRQRVQALESLARIRQMQGGVDAAIPLLEKAIALTAPDNWLRGELQERLIRLYQRAHRTAELDRLWKKNAEENPRDPAAYLQLADLYERLGDPVQQRLWLEKLSALSPKNADYKIRLARLCELLNQPEPAAEWFDQVMKEQPGNADILFDRAEIDVQRDLPQAAHERIETFLRQHGDDESLLARAVGFYSRHRLFDAVEEHLKAAAGRDENGILALADFYFSQHRTDEAKRTLSLLVKSGDDPGAQAAAHSKIAGVLKDQKDPQGALQELRQASALQPQSREYHLALGDLSAGLGRFDEAQAEVEKAFQFSKDEPAQTEADVKLFQIFQMRQAKKETARTEADSTSDWDAVLPSLFRRAGLMGSPGADNALKKYIAAMVESTEKHPTLESLLRVARWQMWSRKTKEAMEFARRAIDLNPDSIAARGLFVKIASTDQKPEAIVELRELIRLDPARETAYARQIGRLEMESGQTDEGIRFFSDLADAKPGDLEVLTDLASALQQAERWDEAAAAWLRAFDLSPASRRKETASPLVHALERLGQYQKAAEVLAKVEDGEPDESRRAGDFQDLLTFCARYELLGWLQTRYEQKLRANADDYFAEIALSKILKATGHDRESFDLMSDATYSVADPVAALRDLVGDAEDSGDFATAIAQQKRIVYLSQQDDPADLEKLAGLQENNFDVEGAGRMWEEVTGRFPRNPAALSHAADFFRRWNLNDKARAILRKIAALDPADLETLTALGQLASEAGDDREALSCYEKILQVAPAENEGKPVKIPGIKPGDSMRLQQTYFTALRLRNGRSNAETMRVLRSFWGDESGRPREDPGARLDAIRAISGILESAGDGTALQNWIGRWSAGNAAQSGEALWAFYYSGAHDRVLKLLEEWMRRDPKDLQMKQAFVWLSLQMGEYAALSEWISDRERTTEERDLLMIALGQLMRGEPDRLDPKLAPGLFPESFKLRQILWQAAVLFASGGHFDEAIPLGERVLAAALTQRSAYGLELAQWHIYTGDIEGARRVLGSVISGTGDSPDAPIYAALREYYFLLPENGRDTFLESYARDTENTPLHSALSLSLLYGLHGDNDKAREQLTKLIAQRAMASRSDVESPPAYRVWSFLLTAGLQFQAWKLNPPTVDLWQQALADEAGIRLQGDQVAEVVREMRLRLLAEKLALADTSEADALLDDTVRSTPPDTVFALATLLQNNGHPALGVKVFQRLWDGNPKNQHLLQSLLNACRVANDGDTEKAVLREALIAEGAQTPPGPLYLQASLQLAARLSNDGEPRAAQKVAEQALRFFPQNRELLNLAAAAQTAAGNDGEAAKIYRRLLAAQPDDAQTRDSLVRALESAGDMGAAIEALAGRGAAGPNENARLARLYIKAGQFDKARLAANTVLQSRAFEQIPGLASLFIENGKSAAAVKLLQIALARCKEPDTLFQLQAKLLESLPADVPQELIDSQMNRLRSFRASPDFHAKEADGGAALYDAEERLAKKFHREDQFQRELSSAWRKGGGDLGAGLKLAAMQSSNGETDRLRVTCEGLFARPDFNEQAFNKFQHLLESSGQYNLLEEGWAVICRKNVSGDQPFLKHAHALFLCGRKQDAADVLETLGCRHVFNDAVANEVAQEYASENNDPAAEKWFALAISKDPDARAPFVYDSYADLLIRRRNFSEAKRVLVALWRNSGSANADPAVLVRYFLESGRDDRIEPELRDFGLSSKMTVDFHARLVSDYRQRAMPLKAIAVAEAHPEIVGIKREIAGILRAAALAGGAFERTAAVLEKVLSQSTDETEVDVGDDLAGVYLDWARQELSTKAPDLALAHLKRANELRPWNYEIAEALCKLHLAKSQPEQAAEVLNRLIAVSQNKADREKAKTWLAALAPG